MSYKIFKKEIYEDEELKMPTDEEIEGFLKMPELEPFNSMQLDRKNISAEKRKELDEFSKDFILDLENKLQRQKSSLKVDFLFSNFKDIIFAGYSKINKETPIDYIVYLLGLKEDYEERFKKFNDNLMLQKWTQRYNDEMFIENLATMPNVLRKIFEYTILGHFQSFSAVNKDILEDAQREFENQKQEILRIIDNEIRDEKEKQNLLRLQSNQPQQPITAPELDISDNSPKERIIILEKLGIINHIKNIQKDPNTISHTSEILSAITGIKSKTLNTYLHPMLQPNRDDTDKNSPYYNPDNLLNANKTLQNLKIKNTDANR
jgi:hypothetical protein